jgi:hypothetical protein
VNSTRVGNDAVFETLDAEPPRTARDLSSSSSGYRFGPSSRFVIVIRYLGRRSRCVAGNRFYATMTYVLLDFSSKEYAHSSTAVK